MLSSSSPDSRSFHTMKSASYNPSLSSSLYSYYLQPSQRFADPSRASSSHQSSGKLSPSGRILVATNAGAICSSVAALTSLRTPGSVHFKASFEDFFQGRRSVYHATDHQSRVGDLAYLKNLGQCFSSELCRYSRISPTCQSVVRSGLEHIINHFLEALVDPEILHRLPSSNKAIISRLGGPKAQEMEVKYLKGCFGDPHRAIRRTTKLLERGLSTVKCLTAPAQPLWRVVCGLLDVCSAISSKKYLLPTKK